MDIDWCDFLRKVAPFKIYDFLQILKIAFIHHLSSFWYIFTHFGKINPFCYIFIQKYILLVKLTRTPRRSVPNFLVVNADRPRVSLQTPTSPMSRQTTEVVTSKATWWTRDTDTGVTLTLTRGESTWWGWWCPGDGDDGGESHIMGDIDIEVTLTLDAREREGEKLISIILTFF